MPQKLIDCPTVCFYVGMLSSVLYVLVSKGVQKQTLVAVES